MMFPRVLTKFSEGSDFRAWDAVLLNINASLDDELAIAPEVLYKFTVVNYNLPKSDFN